MVTKLKFRKKFGIGILAAGILLTATGIVLNFNRLLDVYSQANVCIKSTCTDTERNLTHDQQLIHTGNVLIIGGAVVAGGGGVLLSTKDTKTHRKL